MLFCCLKYTTTYPFYYSYIFRLFPGWVFANHATQIILVQDSSYTHVSFPKVLSSSGIVYWLCASSTLLDNTKNSFQKLLC